MGSKDTYNQKKRERRDSANKATRELNKSRVQDEELLRIAEERVLNGEAYWEKNWEEGKDDLNFLAGKQWAEEVEQERERDGRPTLVNNVLPTYVYRIVGDQRQNDTVIKVQGLNPKSIKNDETNELEELRIPNMNETTDYTRAEVNQGLIMSIEDNCNAEDSYDSAFQACVESGIGFLRVRNDYLSEEGFDQDLLIESIDNQFSVTMDPNAKKEDWSDMNWCLIEDSMSRKEFEKAFPGKTPDAALSDSDIEADGWYSEDKVRICEYFTREPIVKEIALMSNGDMLDMEEAEAVIDDLAEGAENELGFIEAPISIIKTRKVKTYKVIWRKITGLDVLEGPIELNCTTIPVVPVVGKCITIDGKKNYQSAIRWSKDAQRLSNFWDSAAAESVGNASKAPWLGAAEQFEGLEQHWQKANKTNTPYLPYNPIPGIQPPQRQSPPGVPVAELTMSGGMTDKIKQTMGIHDASLGMKSNETSGLAIDARDRQAEIGTFTFSDNLSRALRRVGRLLVEMIPYVYDTERVIRLKFPDGKSDFVQLNKQIQDKDSGKWVTIHNLGVGKFDVKVETGPSYSTQRQEAATKLDNFAKNYPQSAVAIADLVAKNLDFPGADKMAERLTKMVPPNLLDENEKAELEKEQADVPPPPPTPEQQAAMAQAEADMAKAQADTKKAEADALQAEANIAKTQMEIEILKQGGDGSLEDLIEKLVVQKIAQAAREAGGLQ